MQLGRKETRFAVGAQAEDLGPLGSVLGPGPRMNTSRIQGSAPSSQPLSVCICSD